MRFAHVCLTLLLFAPLAGCSGESFPETYKVEGTITYKNQPVAEAEVVLVPVSPNIRSAGALTDAEGKFSVKTYFNPEHQPEGAMSGEYVITVSKYEKRALPANLSAEELQMAEKKMAPPKLLTPKSYLSPSTSPEKLQVGNSVPAPLQLNLKD